MFPVFRVFDAVYGRKGRRGRHAEEGGRAGCERASRGEVPRRFYLFSMFLPGAVCITQPRTIAGVRFRGGSQSSYQGLHASHSLARFSTRKHPRACADAPQRRHRHRWQMTKCGNACSLDHRAVHASNIHAVGHCVRGNDELPCNVSCLYCKDGTK